MKLRGKKVDMIDIREGAQRYKVELRLDRARGDFLAQLGGETFTTKTLDELKEKLRAKAKAMVAYEYKWWIVITYGVDVASGRRGSWNRDWDEVEEHDEIVGLDFRFHVIERSQLVEGQCGDHLVMQRDVEEVDGKLQPQGEPEVNYHYDKNAIEYTSERYAKLCAIRAGLRELARRLHDVVGGGGETIARALDAVRTPPLALTAPEKQRA